MAATTRSPRRRSSGDVPTDVFATNIFQPLINAFEWVLLRFHDGIGLGWGLSIICMTVLVRACLLPLTFKQFKSMQALDNHAPEMKKIKES